MENPLKELQIKSNVKTHLSSYQDAIESDIIIERMSGHTNYTYKISSKNQEIAPIIYRQLGESETNIFLNREAQRIIYGHISDMALGPRIHSYIDQNIRIEEFIESDTLKSSQMYSDETMMNVAYELQRFHSMPSSRQLEKSSLIENIFFKQSEKTIGVCHQKMSQNIYNKRQSQLIKQFKTWVSQQEIQFLKKLIKPLESEELIFSHNDLLANNILVKKQDGRLVFIDYEYSSFNYPIYDIASYFNEIQMDYDVKQYPFLKNRQIPQNFDLKIRKFIECYCLAKESTFQEFTLKIRSEEEKEKIKLRADELQRQFQIGSMLSSIIWGWWAITVCKNPHIDLDFLEYCKIKHDSYFKLKAKWVLTHTLP